MKEDQKEIMNLVKKKSKEGEGKSNFMAMHKDSEEEEVTPIRKTTEAIQPGRFLDLVEADPNFSYGKVDLNPSNLKEWREVFKAIKEGLRLRYYGGKKKLY